MRDGREPVPGPEAIDEAAEAAVPARPSTRRWKNHCDNAAFFNAVSPGGFYTPFRRSGDAGDEPGDEELPEDRAAAVLAVGPDDVDDPREFPSGLYQREGSDILLRWNLETGTIKSVGGNNTWQHYSEQIEFLKQAGYTTIKVSWNDPPGIDKDTLLYILDEIEKQGLKADISALTAMLDRLPPDVVLLIQGRVRSINTAHEAIVEPQRMLRGITDFMDSLEKDKLYDSPAVTDEDAQRKYRDTFKTEAGIDLAGGALSDKFNSELKKLEERLARLTEGADAAVRVRGELRAKAAELRGQIDILINGRVNAAGEREGGLNALKKHPFLNRAGIKTAKKELASLEKQLRATDFAVEKAATIVTHLDAAREAEQREIRARHAVLDGLRDTLPRTEAAAEAVKALRTPEEKANELAKYLSAEQLRAVGQLLRAPAPPPGDAAQGSSDAIANVLRAAAEEPGAVAAGANREALAVAILARAEELERRDTPLRDLLLHGLDDPDPASLQNQFGRELATIRDERELLQRLDALPKSHVVIAVEQAIEANPQAKAGLDAIRARVGQQDLVERNNPERRLGEIAGALPPVEMAPAGPRVE